MNKKRLVKIAAALLLAVVFCLTACGKKQDAKNEISDNKVDVEAETQDLHPYDFTIAFAGDISFAENGEVLPRYLERGSDITKCIDPKLIEEMQTADLMWINNEFVYSNRGEAMAGKAYTFRANPERVGILSELGVDVVGLANNHVYDFGKDAFLDTLDTLNNAGIPYVGAGANLEEASKPFITEIDGKKVAIVAASRAEKLKLTPQATETEPGILRCYDNEIFLEEIKDAAAEADFVIAVPHWGTEYSTVLEQVQMDTAKQYLDAGADAIVGAHTHCLQGFEFYDGKPIAYSLGNFWFNSKTLDTMILKLHFYGDDNGANLEMQVVPARQSNYTTLKLENEEAQTHFYKLEDISVNAAISETGVVTQK